MSMPKNVNDPEGHRQRQRDGSSHQQRRTPIPKSDQGDDDDEDNGLIEAAHQQTDKFLHLLRLVRRARNNKVSRQLRAHGGKRLIHRFAELEYLLSRPHLHGQGNGTVAMPIPVRIARGHVVQVTLGVWYPREMSTRSRRYTGTPVGDAPTSTSPISFVLLNSAVGSISTFLDCVWTCPPGAVMFRAARMSLSLLGCILNAASRSSEYSR